MQQALIWANNFGNGFVQKEDNVWGLSTIPIIDKPIVEGLQFVDLRYIEYANDYALDNAEMVQEVKDICKAYVDTYVLSVKYKKQRVTSICTQYLNNTDWYIIRQLDPSAPDATIPDKILTNRKTARDFIGEAENATSSRLDEIKVLLDELFSDCDSCGNEKA